MNKLIWKFGNFNMSPKNLEINDAMGHQSTLCIDHDDYEESIEVNIFWLRDHCKCNLCYNHETYQRRTNILDIPMNIKVTETNFKDEKVWVKWQDGHESLYDLDFLYRNQYKVCSELSRKENMFLWDKQKIDDAMEKLKPIDLGSFLSDDSCAIEIMSRLVKYGFVFIKFVPANTDMTEMTVKRLFPIQKTLFGEMWTFTSDNMKADTAYTTEHLRPHTDNTYFCDAAGLQIFHCIKFTGTGGQSIFVDGFNALQRFKMEDPKAYKLLTEINVPAEYIDKDQHHTYSAPIIKLDPITLKPQQIRFNLYDRSDFNGIELNKMNDFYESLRKLAKIINDEKNMFKVQLKPGTVVIFDNWRILHGREEFTGERVMTGCYVSRTDFMSKARVYKLVE